MPRTHRRGPTHQRACQGHSACPTGQRTHHLISGIPPRLVATTKRDLPRQGTAFIGICTQQQQQQAAGSLTSVWAPALSAYREATPRSSLHCFPTLLRKAHSLLDDATRRPLLLSCKSASHLHWAATHAQGLSLSSAVRHFRATRTTATYLVRSRLPFQQHKYPRPSRSFPLLSPLHPASSPSIHEHPTTHKHPRRTHHSSPIVTHCPPSFLGTHLLPLNSAPATTILPSPDT